MVRTSPSPFSSPSVRLDLPRILSLSGVIAVHVLAALLLLLPLTRPALPLLAPEDPPSRWTVERVVPVTPTPPIQAELRTEQPPRPRPVLAPVTVQPSVVPSMPVIVDGGSLPATPGDSLAPLDATPGPVGPPLQGAQLRYAIAPPPPYPRDALRTGAEGTVLLRVLVDVDGRPLEVTVERSSGNRSLDREAVRHVQQRWRFEPALQEGRAVEAYGLVPIGFNLQ